MRARTVIVAAVVVVAAAAFVVEAFTKGPLAFAGGHTVALADYHEADPTGVPKVSPMPIRSSAANILPAPPIA